MSAVLEQAHEQRLGAGMLHYRPGDRSGPLSRLLNDRTLVPHFQPIVSLRGGEIQAHEALIRGAPGMPLHMPDALFAAARREGLLHDFVVACVVHALRRWAGLGAGGNLFVNISASALVHCFEGHGAREIADELRGFGADPESLVFELTEHELVSDIPRLVAVAHEMHASGVRFALDDFGDGRSSLRLWSELGPDFVKIDKYFTREISSHAKRLKTLRALMQIAETFGSTLVAEGIETGDDLRVLRDLGVDLGQGYFLGRPAQLPLADLNEGARAVLVNPRVAVLPEERTASSPGRVSQAQVVQAAPLSPQATNEEVAAHFEKHEDWHAAALVDGATPLALIGRQQFLDRYAKLYFKELYGRKPCITFANTSPTIVEVDADANDLIKVLTSADQRYLSEGFIYTKQGRYQGIGTGHQLVRQVTESRIEAARHANPLTLLPGNIPISEHIERLLRSGASFASCYADLSNFKPFNDYFGYWRGDEMIKLAARTIQANCDPQRDFVGHVGGDDFVVLFQSSDWEQRCERMVAEFDAAAIGQYDESAREAGGIFAEDRHGIRRFFGFTSLYAGVVPIAPGHGLTNAADVASAAARAKQAAKSSSSSICVEHPSERRRT